MIANLEIISITNGRAHLLYHKKNNVIISSWKNAEELRLHIEGLTEKDLDKFWYTKNLWRRFKFFVWKLKFKK